MLERIERAFERSIATALRRPRTVSLLAGALFVAAATGLPRLERVVAVEDQLDPHLRSTLELKKLRRLFPSDANLFMIARRSDGAPPTNAEICALEQRIHATALATPDLTDRFSALDLRRAVLSEDRLLYLKSLKDPCLQAASSHIELTKLANGPWANALTDRRAHDFAVELSVAPLSEAGPIGYFNAPSVMKVMDEIKALPGWEHHWMGVLAQQRFALEGMDQTAGLNIAMLLIVGGLLRFLFGTWKAPLIYVVTLLWAGGIVYGAMAWLGQPIDVLAVCLLLILAVAYLEDFVFLSNYQCRHPRRAWRGFFKLSTPTFFTSLTTMIGFGSLAVSSLSSIAHFGVWAALGAFLEWVSLFWVLPCVFKWAGLQPNWARPRAKLSLGMAIAERLGRWRVPTAFARGSLAIFVAAALAMPHFRLAQDPARMFPSDHPFRHAIDYAASSRGWIASASLVFDTDTQAADERHILDELRKLPSVGTIDTFEGALNDIRADITQPLTRALIEREVSSSGLMKRFVADTGERRAVLRLSTTSTDSINELRERAERLCDGGKCFLSGDFVAFSDFSKVLLDTLFESLLLSLVLVASILFTLSVRMLPRSATWWLVTSILWGPALLLCIVWIAKIEINFVTCIIASTVIGLTGDNAIQYLFAARHRGARADLDSGIGAFSGASVQCALTMAIASLVFLLSYFEPPRTLGILLAVGFITSLAGDLWILRGLLGRNSAH